MTQSLQAPLAGIRVLDFGHIVAGPFCARVLADLGADVVKVETSTREGQLGARAGAKQKYQHGRTALLGHVNRSRRSIDLNLKTDEGRTTALKLIGAADVLVENFSTGVMERLGLGYGEMKRVNPRIVYVSMSGYGHTGPRRDWISMNVNLQAHCGLMLITGAPGDSPIGISNSWNDYVAGLHAALAVVGALAERTTTGLGRHLDVSQFEACVGTAGAPVLASAVNGEVPPRMGNRSGLAAPQGCYRCSGRDDWCTLVVGDDGQWRRFADALGGEIPGLGEARFASLEGRLAGHDALDGLIEGWTKARAAADVEQRFRAAGAAAERVRKADQILETREWQQLLRTVDDPPGTGSQVVGVPFSFEDSANTEPYPAPRVGEHTAEVLGEWLGGRAAEAGR